MFMITSKKVGVLFVWEKQEGSFRSAGVQQVSGGCLAYEASSFSVDCKTLGVSITETYIQHISKINQSNVTYTLILFLETLMYLKAHIRSGNEQNKHGRMYLIRARPKQTNQM